VTPLNALMSLICEFMVCGCSEYAGFEIQPVHAATIATVTLNFIVDVLKFTGVVGDGGLGWLLRPGFCSVTARSRSPECGLGAAGFGDTCTNSEKCEDERCGNKGIGGEHGDVALVTGRTAARRKKRVEEWLRPAKGPIAMAKHRNEESGKRPRRRQEDRAENEQTVDADTRDHREGRASDKASACVLHAWRVVIHRTRETRNHTPGGDYLH